MSSLTRRPLPGWPLQIAALALGGSLASAEPHLAVSPDVTLELAAPLVANDEDVVVDDLMGGVSLAPLGPLPAVSEVTGYELLANGDRLLCFETAAELPGGVVALPGDVVRQAGASFSVEVDAAANGVPAGVRCDALTWDLSGRPWLSFDTSVALPGGVTADDEDLVRLDAPGSWSLVFDGSAVGVPTALDLDGASFFVDERLALSFDGSGTIDGVDFDDEDALAYDPVAAAWLLAYDASAQDPAWAAADADALALPEPDALLGLVAGAALLLGFGRCREHTAKGGMES